MPTIASVQESAKNYAGKIIERSSQSQPPLSTMLNQVNAGHGICLQLVAKWIIERAAGRSFWKWLYEDGTSPTMRVVVMAVTNCMSFGLLNVRRSSKRHPGQGRHGGEAGLEDYLRFNGVVPITGEVMHGRDLAHPVGSMTKAAGEITKAVLQGGVANAFLFVSLFSKENAETAPRAGHAMGVFHDGLSYSIYDPNLGEFEFLLASDLAEWFIEKVAPLYGNDRYNWVGLNWYRRG